MIELSDIEKKIEKVDKKMEQSTLAMEMLKELKKSGQRKFIIIIILIVALIATNVGWLIYNAQFETVTEETEQYITQEQTDTDSSTMSGVIN